MGLFWEIRKMKSSVFGLITFNIITIITNLYVVIIYYFKNYIYVSVCELCK